MIQRRYDNNNNEGCSKLCIFHLSTYWYTSNYFISSYIRRIFVLFNTLQYSRFPSCVLQIVRVEIIRLHLILNVSFTLPCRLKEIWTPGWEVKWLSWRSWYLNLVPVRLYLSSIPFHTIIVQKRCIIVHWHWHHNRDTTASI